MCDIVFIRGTRSGEPEFCPHPPAHFCMAKGMGCLSALPHLSTAALCEFHTHCCIHCGRFFCGKCLAVHQPACRMRPTQPGMLELVDRVLHEHMT